MERKAELAVTGRTTWCYGFTNVTIECEQQAAPTKPIGHVCKFEEDPQPHNKWQSKCHICGDTLPF